MMIELNEQEKAWYKTSLEQPTYGEGILMPDCSAIAFTMKLGPLPMYVIAPINTEPRLTAINRLIGMAPSFTCINSPSGSDCESLKNTTALNATDDCTANLTSLQGVVTTINNLNILNKLNILKT